MAKKLNVFAQLNAIIETPEQKRSSSSVVGRGLTSDQECRLGQIEDALPLLRSAMEKLTAEPLSGLKSDL